MAKGVLLASGGLDSTTLAYWLLNNGIDFIPLFIHYGQHCSKKELETLKEVLPKSHVNRIEMIDLSSIYSRSKSNLINEVDLWSNQIEADDLYIPYRNTLILTVAAIFANNFNLKHVYSAFINSNHAKELDCSSKFFDELDAHLSEYGSVKIEMPFRNYSKYDVAKIGLKLGVPIHKTYSCQAQSDIPCGACPNCVDRINAITKILEE